MAREHHKAWQRRSVERPYAQQSADRPDPCQRLAGEYLSQLCDLTRGQGLRSLWWVAGLHTQELAAGIISTIKHTGSPQHQAPGDYCILTKPGDELPRCLTDGNIEIRQLTDRYPDSFIIANRSVVLDLTPSALDQGDPVLTDEPSRVRLYIGLFEMLKRISQPV